jgi:3-oxoacyl-[acyl-carrier-protein] synthase II
MSATSGRRRVVITGLGCVTPVGNDVATTWAALLAGKSAATRVKRFEEAGLRSQVGAECVLDVAKIASRQDISRFARATQMTVVAAVEAWRDAGFDKAPPDLARAGTYVGTAMGDGAETFRQASNLMSRGVRAVHPLYVARCMSNAAPAHVSLELLLRGPSATVASACASAAHALGASLRAIQYGEADVMVAGGGEEMSCVMMQAGLMRAGLTTSHSEAPERASRPFDRRRDGMVPAEGAAMLVLEEAEHAHRRGARVYAELAGVGQATSTGDMMAVDAEAAAAAMTGALADAGWRPEQVGYINAEGSSTVAGDRAEAEAIRRAFGAHASKLAVSSTKSMLGHALGAAPAIGAMATALSIRDGRVHATINQEERDPEIALDVVPNESRAMKVDRALVNAFGAGGACVTLAISRYA